MISFHTTLGMDIVTTINCITCINDLLPDTMHCWDNWNLIILTRILQRKVKFHSFKNTHFCEDFWSNQLTRILDFFVVVTVPILIHNSETYLQTRYYLCVSIMDLTLVPQPWECQYSFYDTGYYIEIWLGIAIWIKYNPLTVIALRRCTTLYALILLNPPINATK